MEKNIKLSGFTSGEIAYLWTTYQFESISKYALLYFLQHVEDSATKEMMMEMKKLSTEIIETQKEIFTKENYPIPVGFSEKDVNLSAPRLFSDTLYLEIMLQSTKLSLPLYQSAFIEAKREDLEQFYQKIISDLMQLEMKIKKLTKDKGQYIPTPRIPNPSQIDYVKKDSFLAGWFAEKRPLLGMEIFNLVFNAKRNGIGHAVITGFSQVARSKEVSNYFKRGKDISLKQLEVFTDILHENDLPTSSFIWTSEVTDSTTAPFSDGMMMQMITTLIASGMSNYGMAMSMNARRDLSVIYTRLLAEVGQYADDGAEIIIKNGWMEQPPIALDRKDLAK